MINGSAVNIIVASGAALKPSTLYTEFGWVQAAYGQLPAPLGIEQGWGVC